MIDNMITTASPSMPIIEITPEYQQAVDLHCQIIANAETAATALISLAQNLKRMRDDKLFTQLGYESFEDYTEKAVGLKRRQAYNYISALEKLPSHLLQSNAHLGITKLELLAQVPALDREEFLEEHNLGEMSVPKIEELVKQIKDQGEQLSMLGADNKQLKEINEQLQADKETQETVSWRESKLEDELNVTRKRIAELESRPVEVMVQEPDEKTIAKIREEARAAAEAEIAAKIKEAEQAAKEKTQKATDKQIQAAKDEAIREAEERFKSSLYAVESERAEALNRANELARQLKAAGNGDTVALSLYFGEINKYFDLIAGLVDKNCVDNPEVSGKFKKALVKSLGVLIKKAEGM